MAISSIMLDQMSLQHTLSYVYETHFYFILFAHFVRIYLESSKNFTNWELSTIDSESAGFF